MNEFLRASKIALANAYDFKRIIIILGNESCDLDSAVCTLVHGLWHYNVSVHENSNEIGVIPVLNVTKNQFKIKTEVIYHLKTNNILLELLTFRDEIDFLKLNERQILTLSLVDHHTLRDYDLPLAVSVKEIIDHRPQDPNWPWTTCDINIKRVGSCATLIAQNIMQNNSQLLTRQISNLLLGPILVDTCNFSDKVASATQSDSEIVHKLESIIGNESNIEKRCEIYSAILRAKQDVSSLTPMDLLEKDLKSVNGIPIPSLPISTKEFLESEGALEALNLFTKIQKSCITIILGMELKGNGVKRDCALFSFLPNDIESIIITELFGHNNGELSLSLVMSLSKKNWCLKLYNQGNLQATRKQILPIIRSASANWRC